jgi:hypothetical protein
MACRGPERLHRFIEQPPAASIQYPPSVKANQWSDRFSASLHGAILSMSRSLNRITNSLVVVRLSKVTASVSRKRF